MTISETINTTIIISFILAFNTFLVSASSSSPSKHLDPTAFQGCINHLIHSKLPFSAAFYSPYVNKTSFTAVLNSTAHNLRLLVPSVAKPQLIFAPFNEIQVRAALVCAQFYRINFRVRSGGHDYEGLSYVSYTGKPFIIVDMSRLRNITVDTTARTAWAQTGATNGELYYRISQASNTLAYPAGICTSLGLGGHLSGGGYGTLMRMYALADDNIIDARIVNYLGEIQDRETMGDDLFWAIRGGAGGSFGIVLSWKVQLVAVPKQVTVFTVPVVLEQGGTDIMYKWQHAAPTMDEHVFIRVLLQPLTLSKDKKTVLALYQGLNLGDKDRTYKLMRKSFPELGLKKQNCTEMTWIESVMHFAGFPANFTPDYLLQAKPAFLNSLKAKSDFLIEPIPEVGLEGMWKIIMEDDAGLVIFTPFGGRVSEIHENAIPFPHRNVTVMIQYVAQWGDDPKPQQQQEVWVRGLYKYMTTYVSSEPRESYVNYRDLDIGIDGSGSNCSLPALWGPKYFKNNFKRLVEVKTRVDPHNVFNHEQSIPLSSSVNKCTNLV